MVNENLPRIAITGATGYIGAALCKMFFAAGFEVIALVRDPDRQIVFATSSRRFRLGERAAPDLFSETDVLIHTAYDFSERTWEGIHQINVQGSIDLLRAAAEAGVKKIIFLSSMAAFTGCRSLYGRGKLLVEQEAPALGAAVIRPGTVYGGSFQGVIGTIDRMAGALPLIPILGTGKVALFLVHIDDLSRLMLMLVQSKNPLPPHPILAADENSIGFRKLVRLLAARRDKSPVTIPVPATLIWTALKSLELIGINPPLRSDSLISITNQNPSPDFSFQKEWGFEFRTLVSSLGIEQR